MEYKGSAVYDNNEFFERYMERRHRPESPNIIMENPLLREMLGKIDGKALLDLGCGDASLGLELLEECHSYTGVDGSKNMCERAGEKIKGRNGNIIHQSMENYGFPSNSFDIVVSQLALHYVEKIDRIIDKVYDCLSNGGKFVFSVQHPLLTSSSKSLEASGKRLDWIVDDYFQSGKRIEPWIGEVVVKYHRTVEDYFGLLTGAGFTVKELREGKPVKEYFENKNEYERRMRIPLFLIFSCEKNR
ncbi:class I SAM-dependent DNA methyltransferase [Metabacillus sp. RGM 3146]|uniref:class I SAM-dependent DNA methyltransferase n=1 Tax=Metabacillus sp. RGM 3146 TaxID=3401092 RepID=UPI003B99890F